MLNKKIKKTNNSYLILQNHHQILDNDRLPMERERERERERDGKEKKLQSNKAQIKKKNQCQLVTVDWTKRL